MKAYEVSDGFDEIFVETLDDAQVVVDAWQRRNEAIRMGTPIKVSPVEIRGIPENERRYVEQLRQAK